MKDREKLKIFKGLANECRLRIIKFLMDGEKCVCEIIPITDKKQCTVSLHLKKLQNLGIIESRKEGKRVYYRISNKNVEKILKCLGDSK